MPKRSSKREDANQTAHRTLLEAIGEKPKTPPKPTPDKKKKLAAAVELGRLGGKKGGPARAASLSATERRAIAQRAAEIRWKEKRS